MRNCDYYFAETDNICFLKLSGYNNYINCTAFKELVDKIVYENKFDEILIDLNEVSYIDSTNLGLIAKCAEYLIEKNNNKPVLYSTNPDINTLLESIGFKNAFILIDSHFDNKTEFNKLNSEEKMPREQLNQVLYDAHKALIRLDEKNRNTFADVIDVLEKKLNKS